MTAMTRAEKTDYLRLLYRCRCGYCGATEAEAGGVLTRDHFRPLTKGGRNSVDNLVYACADCNRAKGDYWGDSPETRLLHPLSDDTGAHLRAEPDGTLSSVSPPGATYLCVLDLNRAALVARRRFT